MQCINVKYIKKPAKTTTDLVLNQLAYNCK